MGMYVIDATGDLWRVDRNGPEDWNNILGLDPSADL
jgi:hypothetical protein